MDPKQITIPDWLVSYVGRQAIMAEAQRVQDAAAISALQQQVREPQPIPVAEPQNGAAREAVGAFED